ncbi:MAG: helix-turn-helix transcriptional regulator [bacterium]|nr:helix-turn-helix transcriptional regulator [bacterium]
MITSLGRFLRELRLNHGEKLKTMAERLGVSSAFLSAIENGRKKMPDEWNEKLAELYALSKKQKEDLRIAIIESGEKVELNIKDASMENRKLAISFARHFDTLDVETSQKIFEILKRNGREE